jgi:hypothetical protein
VRQQAESQLLAVNTHARFRLDITHGVCATCNTGQKVREVECAFLGLAVIPVQN